MSARRKYDRQRAALLEKIKERESALLSQTGYMLERSQQTVEKVRGSGFRYLLVGGLAALAGGAIYVMASRSKSARKTRKNAKVAKRKGEPPIVVNPPPAEGDDSFRSAIKKELIGLGLSLFRQKATEFVERYAKGGSDKR